MTKSIFALSCLLLAACGTQPRQLHGTAITPPKPAHSFTLTDQHRRPYTLGEKRQAVALYFGFTHCKDVCPQTLALLGKARAKAGLSPKQLGIAMITVDAAHDTPAALTAFFKRVGVRAIGLTGSAAQLRQIYKAYGVDVEPRKNDVGHTDLVYLIDASGRLREVFGPDMPINAVADDLRAVVD